MYTKWIFPVVGSWLTPDNSNFIFLISVESSSYRESIATALSDLFIKDVTHHTTDHAV